jgi:hypothetical protein
MIRLKTRGETLPVPARDGLTLSCPNPGYFRRPCFSLFFGFESEGFNK